MARRPAVNRHGRDGAGGLSGGMRRVLIPLAVVVVLAIVGGFLFLAYWDFPVPSTPTEKVLPDARFPK